MKTVNVLSLIIYFVAASFSAPGQEEKHQHNASSSFYGGMGLGLDYGGIGFKAEILPVKYVGGFIGIGYNLHSIGFNIGASFKALPDKRITPTAMLMYGYNAVIVIKGGGEISKTYYGPTTGIGADFKVGKRNNKLSAGLLVPLRSKKFRDDYDDLKNNPAVKIEQGISPIGFSIGFNWAL